MMARSILSLSFDAYREKKGKWKNENNSTYFYLLPHIFAIHPFLLFQDQRRDIYMTQPNEEQRLTHLDDAGQARMVDISHKIATRRQAIASGRIEMHSETLAAIHAGALEKGDVLAVARVAGIMAAKETSRLIPLCHPIALNTVSVDFAYDELNSAIQITATAITTDKTGIEMEALTAVSIAALTIYDMAKAIDKEMRITGIHLESKTK
jgi:cyclic pyranopterin phosphate synthase